MILVNTVLTAVNAYNGEGDEHPLETCAIDLHPVRGTQESIRITGVYAPPRRTTDISMKMLLKCSTIRGKNDNAEQTPHLIMGDFNTPEWGELFDEWRSETGLWELTDPAVPTHNEGNALDRILFKNRWLCA